MELIDLFPPCPRDDCAIAPGAPVGHKHILPSQQEMLDSTEQNVLASGGFGSGKSVTAAVMGHRLSVSVAGNRGIVIRRTYPKLHDTAMRVFFEVLERSGVDYEGRERRDSWPHWIIYPNGSEIFFRESKDLGRFLGPEYGWAWVDEAIEEPEKTFIDLMGRIRLPAAGRYLKLILTTNPPPFNHWITKHFGERPGVIWKDIADERTKKIIRVGFRRVGSTSMDNPALPDSYVAGLKAILKPGEVDRVLRGKTGFVYSGKAVYGGAFDYAKHVGEWEPEVHPADGLLRPMARSWDFGFHAPAVLFAQIYLCWKNSHHLIVVNELTPNDVETETLGKMVMDMTKMAYPNCNAWTDIGDTAGAAKGESGPGPIVRLSQPKPKGLGLLFRHKKFNNMDPGIDFILALLKKPPCKCGKPILGFNRRCTLTIDGLSGGYHYPMQRYDREERPKPVKDGVYDNPMDALRYLVELGYRPRLIDNAMLDRLNTYKRPEEYWTVPGKEEFLVRIDSPKPVVLP